MYNPLMEEMEEEHTPSPEEVVEELVEAEELDDLEDDLPLQPDDTAPVDPQAAAAETDELLAEESESW